MFEGTFVSNAIHLISYMLWSANARTFKYIIYIMDHIHIKDLICIEEMVYIAFADMTPQWQY